MSAELLNPPTPTFHHLGPPKWWQCPHCSLHVLMFPALPSNHVCANLNPNVSVRTFYYYYALGEDQNIRTLCLIGVIEDDPLLRVTSTGPNGHLVPWERRSIDGELRFFSPDPAQPFVPDLWYDGRIQQHQAVPREELEYRASRGAHSA